MKSINIKGNEYVLVHERLMFFREKYPEWSLISEIVNSASGEVTIKASVIDEKGIVRATGHAYEKEGSTYINKTSHVENCETSAWGRALGNLGIGIDTSVASADEVQNAIANQNKPAPKTAPKKAPKLAETGAESVEIMKEAFDQFSAKYCLDIPEGWDFDFDKFIKAVNTTFSKLPTNKASIPLIVEKIKPVDVLVEEK